MTAQDLFELLNPLWLKHPGTRMRPGIEFEEHCKSFCDHNWDLVDLEDVADLAAIAIVKWWLRSAPSPGVQFILCNDKKTHRVILSATEIDGSGEYYTVEGIGQSELEAAVSAAMAMEVEPLSTLEDQK